MKPRYYIEQGVRFFWVLRRDPVTTIGEPVAKCLTQEAADAAYRLLSL